MFRQLKYEQDLEFYATARQLRWKQLKHQRKNSLKRLKNEKIKHRLESQTSLLGVRITKLQKVIFFFFIFLEVECDNSQERNTRRKLTSNG